MATDLTAFRCRTAERVSIVVTKIEVVRIQGEVLRRNSMWVSQVRTLMRGIGEGSAALGALQIG